MLKDELIYLTPMKITGYPTLYNNRLPMSPDMVMQYMFDNQPMDFHFKKFLQGLQKNSTFYPVYRMADGEFAFCMDRHKEFLFRIKSLLKNGNSNFKTIYGENYSKKEIADIKNKFIKQLQFVSSRGKLAIHLSTFSFDHMVSPVLSWFDQNGITLTPQNYIPFYFIYALFGKQYRDTLIHNKDILIITSLTSDKKKKLQSYFISNGAKTISFINISPNKSLFEKIDLSGLTTVPQLVLIAAGVGAVNILAQLEPLNALSLDIGIIMDAVINTDLNKSRIFIDL